MGERTLAHIGYVVNDLESIRKRFEREGARTTLPPTDDPVQKVRVCVLQMDGSIAIELVAPLSDDDSPIQSRLRRGGGLDHLCFYVDDLQAELEAEQRQGAVVVCPPTYAVAFGRDIAFVHRRSGVVVELMTRHETSPL